LFKRPELALYCAAVLTGLAPSASASTNYVTNGSFEQNAGIGQLGFNTSVTGWTNAMSGANAGYNFLFGPGTADGTGATGADGNLKLWGPGSGSNNGLPATSPDGGYYIAADGAYEVGAISQTLSQPLSVGQEYEVGFWWAGAQQTAHTGLNTEQWEVSLGDQSQFTTVVDNVSEGFTGWKWSEFFFTADASDAVSPVLSFLAIGTPNGVPPFSLIDGVNLQVAPEPSTLALIGLGLLAVPLAARLRKSRR